MKELARFMVSVLMLLVLALGAPPCLAIEHTHIENFSTTRYKDAANTTALWDTVAGELRLHPFVATIRGTYNTSGNAWGVAVAGGYAYVADDLAGLRVIDVGDPQNPTLVGTYDTPGNARGVAVDGNRAYVADGDYGLQVINISNPASPALLGTYNTSGSAYAVAVSGNLAYVADNLSGLQIINVSNPASPALLGTRDTPGMARGVAVSGLYAYVGDYGNGLQVIDVKNPASPVLVGTYNTPGSAIGVAISGFHAFVADFGSGLCVVNITNPASPVLAGTYDTPGYAWGVAVSGNRAYVADDYVGLQVIDVSDPAHPASMEIIDTPGAAFGVAVDGCRAFVADYGSGLQVIQVASPVAPGALGAWDGYALNVAIFGDYAFVAGNSTFNSLDISDPSAPTVVGTLSGDFSGDVALAGDRAVTFGNSSIQVIDVRNPSSPAVLGTCSVSFGAYSGFDQHIAVSGHYAFATRHDYWGTDSLYIVDVANPASPFVAAKTILDLDVDDRTQSIVISGNCVYIACIYRVAVVNIANPMNPIPLASSMATFPGQVYDIAIFGNRAYVPNTMQGLQVFDVSDPAHAVLLGSSPLIGNHRGAAVCGDRVIMSSMVAADASKFIIFDVSDPAQPEIVGETTTPGYAGRMSISGEHLYASDGNGYDLRVFQVGQSEVDQERNAARSLAFDGGQNTVFRVSMDASQDDLVEWELSADGGASWQGIIPNASWNYLGAPGKDLLWRSTLTWVTPGSNPVATEAIFNWRVEEPIIESIVDLPDDQGGVVRLSFARSGRDYGDETALPVTSYGIWRRIDNAALIAALESPAAAREERDAAEAEIGLKGVPLVACGDRVFARSLPALATSSFPPGTWEWVGTVPALQKDSYIAAVPTAEDSSSAGGNETVLVITAHTITPTIWYVSEPDSGWSVDNIAPGVPTGFVVAYNTGSGNELAWDPSPAEDFQYFRVYRGTDPDFIPSLSNLVHSTAETSWSDPEFDGWSVYYKITALDYVGNESAPASAETVTGAEEKALPRAYELYPNVPNPFNPITTIRYDVPVGGGAVTLRIYDVAGRLVRTLVNGQQTAGRKQVAWNGTDDRDRRAVSGVYFCRLDAPGYKKTLKMILVK